MREQLADDYRQAVSTQAASPRGRLTDWLAKTRACARELAREPKSYDRAFFVAARDFIRRSVAYCCSWARYRAAAFRRQSESIQLESILF